MAYATEGISKDEPKDMATLRKVILYQLAHGTTKIKFMKKS